MSKLIIIGNIPNYKTGPGDMLRALLKGLDEMNEEYTFINTFADNAFGKIRLYLNVIFLILYTRRIINVHTFGYSIPFIICLQSFLNKSNKYYLTVHGIRSYENKANGKKTKTIDKFVERMLYKKFPNIICVSLLLKKTIMKEFERKNNLHVVYNGLSKFAKYQPRKSGVKFIYAGGYSKLKNPVECIEIFKKCMNVFPNADLMMCGGGDSGLKEIIEKKISNDNLKNRIKIKDKLTGDILEEMYRKSSFILAPSKWDTFNMTVLEGMNMGCIPIVSNNCGVKELFENKCGIVYDDLIDIDERIRNIDLIKTYNLCHTISLGYTYLEMSKNYLEIFGGNNE